MRAITIEVPNQVEKVGRSDVLCHEEQELSSEITHEGLGIAPQLL